MAIAEKFLTSLIYRNPPREYKGFTLFLPVATKNAFLIDMEGRLVNKWELPYYPSYDMELLRNGNLLYMAQMDRNPMKDFEGHGSKLVEMDWSGRIAWEHEDDFMHNSFYRLKNGNTVYLRWVKTPENIALKVKGGVPDSAKSNEMWSDEICEINKYGRVVYIWKSYEHLDINESIICPLDHRKEWTHSNSCYVLENGDLLVIFTLIHSVAIIEKSSGNIKWIWGPGEIAHPHSASGLDNGNILIFDNGLHCNGEGVQFSKVIEVNPNSKKIVWEYREDALAFFYSSILGSCQRLGNGNTLISDSVHGRIFEVTGEKEVIWEYVNPYFGNRDGTDENNIITKAIRYPVDYPAFKNKTWLI